jgi:ribosomal protein S18 acetylase RimI-like enzyme
VATPLDVGPLEPGHRARIEEILQATGVFRDEEVAVALELFDEGIGPTPGTRYPAPGTAERDPDYLFIGAFAASGELMGFACYGPTPGTDRTHDLYWIAVHPGAQGAGAGTHLLDEVERRLRNVGARLLVVETSGRDEYRATRGFYAAREYAVSARVRDFYAPGDDRIIFTKRLTPRSVHADAE